MKNIYFGISQGILFFSFQLIFCNTLLALYPSGELAYQSYCRSSDIRTVTQKNFSSSAIILFQKPSNSIIGIKFDNILDKKNIIELLNSKAQKVVSKEIAVTESFISWQQRYKKGVLG